MRYIHFTGGNGYCGCNYFDYIAFEDNIPDDFINNFSIEMCRENAEDYAYVAFGWGEIPPEDSIEYEEYIENALEYANWEEVSEEEYKEYAE